MPAFGWKVASLLLHKVDTSKVACQEGSWLQQEGTGGSSGLEAKELPTLVAAPRKKKKRTSQK